MPTVIGDTPPTIGSLCTGYGGLDLAAEHVTGGNTVWTAEIDGDCNRILDHRFPHSERFTDFTDPSFTPPPVDVLTAGFPCQPVSHAGNRKGTDDDRWLWDDITALVGRMDPPPRLLLLENVAGLLTANDGHAMADVVHGLARLGYMGSWRLLRASDIGACHQRRRWFCVAHLADTRERGWDERITHIYGGESDPVRGPVADPERAGARLETSDPSGPGRQPASNSEPAMVRPGNRPADAEGTRPSDRPARVTLPTPNAWDGARGPDLARLNRPESGGMDLVTTVERLLPTPTSQAARHGTTSDLTANGHGYNLWDIPHYLPTPTSRDWKGQNQRNDPSCLPVAIRDQFGNYAEAIHQHTQLVGRPAPDPATDRRLNPAFVEWMMGLPEHWVCDPTLDLSRTAQLRILGNGVVPQQAAHAYTGLLSSLPF